MSLPPGFLDELRTRTSLAQVVGRKVMWDQRKSNQGKGDMWAPCPFHQEKTASFHVDDSKGYYYCFGCHAKGDAISFVRETENVSFMEAIEILARESGLPMPERDPQAQQKADRRAQLAEVMEQAVLHYRLQLKTAGAAEAREYLARRGLSEAALERWEIGFAPDTWQGLWDHLTGKNVTEDLILGAGLAKPSQKGGKPYDTFRGRIMFPIRDARGRATAFGGRAMDPNDNAKYLNSPETELFDKGRSLFNMRPAREAAGKGQPLIVAEGYMDVIALSEAGFTSTVAPLGTAITEDQLQLIWRIAPEPIIALDGDTAGLRAAMRLIDLALPLLEAGKSLRFCIMPQGQDPDDVIRAGGAGAMQALLDTSFPMVKMLWQRETDGQDFDSPERKAAVVKSLRDTITRIKDRDIRRYYGEAIRHFLWEKFRAPNWAPDFRRKKQKEYATSEAKRSFLARDSGFRELEALRERVTLGLCIKRPELLVVFEHALESFEFLENGHQKIALQVVATGYSEDSDQIVADLGSMGLAEEVGKILTDPHFKILPALLPGKDIEIAKMTVAEQLAKLEAERALRVGLIEFEEDIFGVATETDTWRIVQASAAVQAAGHAADSDKEEYEMAPSGAKVSRLERDGWNRLLNEIGLRKPN